MIIIYVQVPYDDDRIRNVNFVSLSLYNYYRYIEKEEEGGGEREREREQTALYVHLSLFPFYFSYYCNATFFLLRCVDSFRLPMMFWNSYVGVWVTRRGFYGDTIHCPIEPQSYWPRNACEARPE